MAGSGSASYYRRLREAVEALGREMGLGEVPWGSGAGGESGGDGKLRRGGESRNMVVEKLKELWEELV